MVHGTKSVQLTNSWQAMEAKYGRKGGQFIRKKWEATRQVWPNMQINKTSLADPEFIPINYSVFNDYKHAKSQRLVLEAIP